jgi:serine/threonine-protein kinase
MPQYVDGHLLFVRKGTLFAAPFDEERLELRAEPVPIVDGIEVNEYVGTAQFAASSNGTLVYLPGGEYVSPIQWSDRQGRLAPLRAAADDWGTVAFSPDGERLAMDMLRGAGRDIVVYDWKRDLVTPVTSDEADDRKPVWSPDGQRIVFTSKRGGSEISYLYWRRADGTGPIERLTRGTWPEYPSSWHHSGKYLAYTVLNPQTTQDIMILPVDGDEGSGWKPGEPRVFLNTPGNDGEPAFSPDGRWIAYTSERATMYVQPFPGPGPRVPVATNGAYPVWSRARNELFYAVFRTGQLMMVPFTVNGTFRPEKPRPWSDIRYDLGRTTSRQRHFDLHADGNRFAVVTEAASTAKDHEVVIVFNALEALRRKGPTTP